MAVWGSYSSGGASISQWESVADAAELATLDVRHSVAYVETFRDFFAYRASSTATSNGITVVSASGGVGRWERVGIPSASWKQEGDWVINSVSGSDEATGRTGAPLKTWAEFARRLGAVQGTAVIEVATTVLVEESLGVPDPMNGRWQVKNGARLTITGVQTEVFSGTLSAVQNLNTATNAETQATSTWTPATHVRRLVRSTTSFLYAWLAADLGGGNARMSTWSAINEVIGGTVIGTGNASAGDTVSVKTLTTVAGLQLYVSGTAGATSPFVLENFEFTSGAGTSRSFSMNAQPMYQNCKFSGAIRFGAGSHIFNNCCLAADGAYAIDYSAYMRLNAGLCAVSWSTGARPQSFYEFRSSVLFQAAALPINWGCIARIDSAWFMDVANPIQVINGAALQLNGTLNGYNNTGYSISMQQASTANYLATQVFGIVSAAGDISCGGLGTAYVFDPAAGAIVAAPVATTFANLLAATPAGFGGSIADPKSGVRFAAAV